jgi:hypothetical protein
MAEMCGYHGGDYDINITDTLKDGGTAPPKG